MANSLSNLVPKIIARALLALRQNSVMLRLVRIDLGDEARSFGDTIDITKSAALTASDVTPAAVPPTPASVTPTKVQLPLNRWRKVNFHLTDKEKREIDYNANFVPMEMSEAMKTLGNDIDAHLLDVARLASFHYTGTAGTTPFVSDTVPAKDARKFLNAELSPLGDRRIVLDVDAEANAGDLALFKQADQRGDQQGIIEGQIGRKLGFDWFLDQNVPSQPTNATGAGALTVNGAHSVGDTTISIAKGAGANWEALAGDIISFAGDPQTYRVVSDVTVVQGTNTTVTIFPALEVALAGSEAVTKREAHVMNLAFHQGALAFASRPMVDEEGMGNVIQSISDPVSGATLRLEISRQHKQTVWEVDILYGAVAVYPEQLVRIAG